MNNIIKVSNWTDLDDLINTLDLNPNITQLEFLYQSEEDNLYWIELNVNDNSITEYQNRRK